MSTILVVDDKEMMRDSVGSTLQRAGFRTVAAHDGQSALDLIARSRPDAVVTDLKMPGLSGLELLEKIRAIDDELPVVLMTAFGAVQTAVQAIKLGAFDYITKPFEGDELIIAVKRAISHASVVRENALLRLGASQAAGLVDAASNGNGSHAQHSTEQALSRLIGASPAMRRVKEQIHALAESHATVLICGESGAGKEVVAKAIHDLSPRRDAPFLAVNCAALSESLLESELFGHERGAFTGAERLRKGRFELADGGTLLLDEVSEISPQLQAKLLRVLQERAFERVGSSVTIGVDVRIIATSNRNLPGAVAAGDFRQDLFFRLNVLPIHLPPLRDRIEDVQQISRHFVHRFCSRDGHTEMQFNDEAISLLTSYDWPGNVRELQNICERAVVLNASAAPGRREIPASLIAHWIGAPTPAPVEESSPIVTPAAQRFVESTSNGPRRLEEIEREAIIQTLQQFNGHRQKTAKALGIGVRTLGLKLKKWKEQQLVAQSL